MAWKPTLLHILQHSLGLDEFGQGNPYRNHYVAGGEALDICRDAVTQGLMVEHAATDISGGSPWFHVTDAGKQYVAANSPKPPKKTASQKRYERFLTISDMCDVTFGEFLKREKEFR